MARLGGILLFALVSSPAAAAGGFDGLRAIDLIIFFLPHATVCVLLPVAIGFFLQAFFRFRNALILLSAAALAFLALLAAAHGLEKTVRALPLLIFTLLVFSPLLGLGWYLAVKDAKRAAHQKLT